MGINKKIALFISGAGTNARNIVQYFQDKKGIEVTLIVSSNPNSTFYKQVLKEARLETYLLKNIAVLSEESFVNYLQRTGIDLIVLAGFLWKIPPLMVQVFPQKIVNIHPSLLPKYGGKGMYGRFVHRAVIADQAIESGITIHYVNEEYDEGAILFQAKVQVAPYDTAVSLETKIHKLEYTHYPEQIEALINRVIVF